MDKPEEELGGAFLVQWAKIGHGITRNRNCRHLDISGKELVASGLAIYHAVDEGAFYLIGCDEDWRPITDTWHETLTEALELAELEFSGIGKRWLTAQ